jgi:hypothetical protein
MGTAMVPAARQPNAEENLIASSCRIGCLLVAILLLGCTHWEPFPTPTPDAEAPRLPTALRVWTSDRQGTELSWPLVRADTLYGRSRGDTLAFPLSDIQRLEGQRLKVARTVATVVGSSALLITVGLLGGGLE